MRRVTTRKELVALNTAEYEARKAGGPVQRGITGLGLSPAGLILWVKYVTGNDLLAAHHEAINAWAANYSIGCGNAVLLAKSLLYDPEAFRLAAEPSEQSPPPGVVPFGEEPAYHGDRLLPWWDDAGAVIKTADTDKQGSVTSALVGRLLEQCGLVLPSAAELFDAVGEQDPVTADDWRRVGQSKPHVWIKGMFLTDPEAAICVTTLTAAQETDASERSMLEWCTGKRIQNEGAKCCQVASRAIISGPDGGQFATYDDAKHMPAGAVKGIALVSYWLESRHLQESPGTFRVGDPPAAVANGRGGGESDLVDGGEAAPAT